MIDKWILDNFKSINKETELEFRPLTIFTGANSSGKSTVLQSILLVTQTLQNQIPSKSIVLNGWFKKFGSFSDIVHLRDDGRNIKIGFEVSHGGLPNSTGAVVYRRYDGVSTLIDKAKCNFVVSSGGVKDSLQPIINRFSLFANSVDGEWSNILIERSDKKSVEDWRAIESSRWPFNDDLSYRVLKEQSYLFRESVGGLLNWNYIGATFNHFLPSSLIGYVKFEEKMKISLYQYFEYGYSPTLESPENKKLVESAIKAKGLAIADEIERKWNPGTKTFTKAYEGVKTNFTLKKLQTLLGSKKMSIEDRRKFISQLLTSLSNLPEKYTASSIVLDEYNGTRFVRDFFRERIKYLGPLREEPKSLYPIEPTGESTELGLKGENTAAILEANKEKVVDHVSPQYNRTSDKADVKKVTLMEAVNEWLVYLGVAQNINTDDQGKFGHVMKIDTDVPDMHQDLTHVGVGVSQVLPILVMCLLANRDETIILEQPELHLHPKVQTRLADFFVAMNALGKQCLIETHSEYLINRLRYLVAISDDCSISDDTMIYFVEKEEGHSVYRPVTINKYGVIDEWPDGFFDESEKIAEQVLRAGYEKRKKEKMMGSQNS